MNGTDITELVTIGIVAIIAIAFLAGTFLCWIAGSYFRKIYYVCVTLWEVFGILILFIGSSVDDTGIFGIMLIIAVILLVCILILYEHQRRLADALNILMLIWISIAESGILTAKSQNTMASIVALVCLALAVIAALIVYQADEYSTILPSSFLGAAVCGLLGGWFFPYNLDDDPSKIFFLMLGIEIVLTAVGCLLQIFILEQGDWSVNLDDVDDDDDIDVYTTESLVDFSAWSNGSEMKCQLRDGADGNKYVVGFFGNKICNEKLQAEFPGGIVLGQSTREDVKKAYGEDSYDVYRGFGGNSLGYWKEFGVGVSFGFDQDGRLTGFALENDPQQYN